MVELAAAARGGDERRMGGAHALGTPGGAGRVQHHGHVVGTDLGDLGVVPAGMRLVEGTAVLDEPVVARHAAPSSAGAVKTPLPGVILSIDCKVGDVVKRGQKVAVLEAMKMENNINADREGKVIEIKVSKGDSVLEGADIIIIG